MKQPRDLALRFLRLADRDLGALAVLVGADDVADEPIGFHAQQAVEKCLKAALALRGVAFRKTHDLAEHGNSDVEEYPQAPGAVLALRELQIVVGGGFDLGLQGAIFRSGGAPHPQAQSGLPQF